MPPFGRRVYDISGRRYKWSETFDVIRLLTAHDDPHLGEVGVIVAEIARPVFHIGSIATDDVGMRAVLANREIAPRAAAGMLFLQLVEIEKQTIGLAVAWHFIGVVAGG